MTKIQSKRWMLGLLLSILPLSFSFAQQSAKAVLDKTAQVVSNKGGITAHFSINSAQMGSTSGTIAVKGNKFHATTPMATIWFDGKTQWTYVKNNDEVNISTPKEAELQAINPYNFINMYRSGFSYTMTSKGQNYVLHLTATNKKRSVLEMYITVNKKTYVPTQVKMRQSQGWTTINISQFRATTLNDSMFKFNAREFPHAEIIDLR